MAHPCSHSTAKFNLVTRHGKKELFRRLCIQAPKSSILSNLRKKLKRSWATPELNFKHLGDLGNFRILISNIQRSQEQRLIFNIQKKKPRFNAWRPWGEPIIGIAECRVVIAQRIIKNGFSLGFGSSETAIPNVNQLRTGPGRGTFWNRMLHWAADVYRHRIYTSFRAAIRSTNIKNDDKFSILFL